MAGAERRADCTCCTATSHIWRMPCSAGNPSHANALQRPCSKMTQACLVAGIPRLLRLARSVITLGPLPAPACNAFVAATGLAGLQHRHSAAAQQSPCGRHQAGKGGNGALHRGMGAGVGAALYEPAGHAGRYVAAAIQRAWKCLNRETACKIGYSLMAPEEELDIPLPRQLKVSKQMFP